MTQSQKQGTPQDVGEARREKRENFLKSLGWKNISMQLMPADASFRRYYRLPGAPKPMLLMEDPPDRPKVPPFVMVEPFILIADHLRSLGLRTPEIYFRDIPNGLLVIEDFGDDTYTRLFGKGADLKPLYEMATDVLAHLHRHPERKHIKLPDQDAARLAAEAMLLLDWYVPALTGGQPSDEMKESFAEVWKSLVAKFPKDQKTLVLRDYHVDNLMVVPGAKGILSCGLLDFQDALTGQFSYDMMSLLEDARRDVPEDLRKHLYDRYIAGMGAELDRAGFDYSFRVLSLQRHARVLGIFMRLSVRDGKDKYLQFIPHVRRMFMESLADPAMKPMKEWFESRKIDIGRPLKNG
ncbi:MAG: phosphotransferase [Pseudomonadota bacterium]